MEITLKTMTLFAAIFLTGLSAGLFYAWEFSVIPGTKRVAGPVYLETMQAINRAIINPAFLLIFMGSLVAQTAGALQFRGTPAFWLLLTATACYLFGTILVTSLGNVPLNNALDALNLPALNPEQVVRHRQHYELRWNRLHTIRTAFAVLSFLLLLIAAYWSYRP